MALQEPKRLAEVGGSPVQAHARGRLDDEDGGARGPLELLESHPGIQGALSTVNRARLPEDWGLRVYRV